MMRPHETLLAIALLASSSAALQLPAVAQAATSTASAVRLAAPHLRRAPTPMVLASGGDADQKLSDEQIAATAAKATEDPASWPDAKPPPQIASVQDAPPAEGLPSSPDGFDPRIIAYVGLPALVLIGQLFFTFSRDALGDVALGPAVMDLYLPPL